MVNDYLTMPVVTVPAMLVVVPLVTLTVLV